MPEDNKHVFVYWVQERDRIAIKKMRGDAKPWTEDAVFKHTYFCNTDRELDKVTKAIRGLYGPQHPDIPSIPNMVMARLVNKPESLERMCWPWSKFYDRMWTAVMSQPGAWGGAYIVSTNGRAMPKHEYIAGLLEDAFEQFGVGACASIPPTLRAHSRAIQGLQGMGSFMAAQVVADLKNTEKHPLANADDWHTWSSHGPGSLRGLSWFHGHKITPGTYAESIASAREWYHNSGYTDAIAHLCNQNLQNCFCEYDKYQRVRNNTGR